MIPAQKNRRFEQIFHLYNHWLIRRFFSAVYVKVAKEIQTSEPTLYVANHSNWWDGLLAFQVNKDLLHQDAFIMMHEKRLTTYRFFSKLGAFSINPNSYRDIRESLEYGSGLLKEHSRSLWLFPQGEIAHQDVRPLRFLPGVGYLLETVENVQVVPVSFYYSFEEEQRPAVYIHLAPPLLPELFEKGNQRVWTHTCEKELTHYLDGLRHQVINKETHDYQSLIRGFASTRQLFKTFFRIGN